MPNERVDKPLTEDAAVTQAIHILSGIVRTLVSHPEQLVIDSDALREPVRVIIRTAYSDNLLFLARNGGTTRSLQVVANALSKRCAREITLEFLPSGEG